MYLARFTVLLILFLSCSYSAAAQQIHTYVNTDSLRVGDLFTYTIVFEGNYSSIQFPSQDSFEEELSVKSIQRYQSPAGRDSIVYQLQFFAIEDFTVGRKEIRVQTETTDTTYTTTAVPLFFKTSLAADEEEFRPLKPIFDFARAWWPWIISFIILLILTYYGYRWYTNRDIPAEVSPAPAPTPAEPFTSPLIELKQTISNLSDISELTEFEEFEQYYIDLGDAIRLYLKKVYSFQALEMTTSEITRTLQEELAPPKLITITRKVLNEADIVKFANFNPGQEGARSALESAQRFIETAEVVNFEQIKFMKYKYEVKHGLRDDEIKYKPQSS